MGPDGLPGKLRRVLGGISRQFVLCAGSAAPISGITGILAAMAPRLGSFWSP